MPSFADTDLQENPLLEEVSLEAEREEEFIEYKSVTTSIPARLDRLPFSKFHYFVVFTLGITWMLDGLEVTLVAIVSGLLKREDTLHLTDFQLGVSTSVYLSGAITGSLVFGYLCDRFGRKRLYITTPLVYLIATALTAFSWDWTTFTILRFITGAGLGGEYSAMNSAIDELIPAPVRGTVDLTVNGSYWLGNFLASGASIILLNPAVVSNANIAWRLMFIMGAVLGISIVILRLYLPESPRWLLTHGRGDEAEKIVADIEHRVCKAKGISVDDLPPAERSITIKIQKKPIGFGTIAKTMIKTYPKRSILGMSLMISQAFFYNAIAFSYALVLIEFYGVSSEDVGLFLMPFALGNFLGPLTLGRLFDILGRRFMITSTYFTSGVLLIISGVMFVGGQLNAVSQTIFWSVIFFVASPAASSAYLTVSEIFPLEIRGLAISMFYSIGTGIGGMGSPALFGALLQTAQPVNVLYGYLIGAGCMIAAAFVELFFGVKAEQKSLEEIAAPLSSLNVEMSTIADKQS